MGGAVSCLLPRYGCCVPRRPPNTCKENHSTPHKHAIVASAAAKKNKHRRNLSAAFNLADLEFTPIGASGDNGVIIGEAAELLNVNSATEEELMTLPGVNRQTAHNIVEYRKQIGAFKMVEDLALVSGVGATKLSILRQEISVRRANKSSSCSSASSSRADLSYLQDSISRSSSKSAAAVQQLYSINTSNVFQLMKVKGVSQPLAENVVMHREKKGLFRTVDDLLKVKGWKPYILSAVQVGLTVEDVVLPSVINNNGLNDDTMTGGGISITCHPPATSLTNLVSVASTVSAAPHGLQSVTDSQEDIISLYGPLTKKSFRGGGRRKPTYFTKRNNRPVMRLGSWNLQRCAKEKCTNPGVKEVVAMTVLENGLGILGVQELGDADALQKLCDELNQPSIPAVRKFAGHRGAWRCVTSEAAGLMVTQDNSCSHLGFLYDTSRGVDLMSAELLDTASDGSTPLTHRPFVARFKLQEFELAVVNIHLSSSDEPRVDARAQLEHIIAAIEQRLGEKPIVLLGDFDRRPDSDDLVALRERGYQNTLAADKYTNISVRNPSGSCCYDNVWVGPHTAQVYTGTCDVIREGLTSPWIPDGWGWGGLASEHCPLWAEFYTDSDLERSSASISVKDIQCALKMGVVGAADF